MKSQLTLSKNFEDIRDSLIRLGFSFNGKLVEVHSDPEKTILSLCSLMFREPKAFKILITWAKEVTPVLNVERLKSLYELYGESDSTLNLGLYILTSRLIESGDKRYQSLNHILFKILASDIATLPKEIRRFDDDYLIESHGLDPALSRLNIRSYYLEGADEKKSLKLKQILKLNPWLRFRAIIGSNYRADVLYLKSLGKFKTRYELWKNLGSSQETAYRICNEIDQHSELKVDIDFI